MQSLIQELFLASFGKPGTVPHDAAVVEIERATLAFTTDSYVVQPLFFPGGDIGGLAVHGTVNDLAMAGARPLCLSAAFIIEEGLPMEVLSRVVASMRAAAERAGVRIITGDTKVVDRGKGDGLFINTAGIGRIEFGARIHPARVQPGDVVLVSGDLGRHGMAVMAVREGLDFETTIESDSAPLWEPVRALLEAGVDVHCLRDVTRGGLTACVHEIAVGAGVSVVLEEDRIPVAANVRAACEVLGLDPLQVACEGRFCAFVPAAEAERATAVLQGHPASAGACRVGRVHPRTTVPVVMRTPLGPTRILDLPAGEQLPRIC
jgi:hydrogenase expression/formation protein HypE